MWYVRHVLYAVLYVRVSGFIVRGCGVSRRYIEGMSVVVNVMMSLMSVMSPSPALCNLSMRTAVKLCIWGVLVLGVSLVS